MINNSLTICILARNCEKQLIKNIPLVEELRAHFQQSNVIVIENDSTDKTKEILLFWEKTNSNITLFSNNFSDTSSEAGEKKLVTEQRISRMVKYRNIYLEEIKKKPTDYILVIDIDIEWFSVKGIVSAILNAPRNWGALFAFGYKYFSFLNLKLFKTYYDLFAFIEEGQEEIAKTFFEMQRMIKLITRKIKRNRYVKCRSAFAGIGIYKYECIKDISYILCKNTRSNIMDSLCEHIPFNISIPEKFDKYICNEILVKYEKRTLKNCLLEVVLPFKLLVFFYETLRQKKYPR